MFTAQERAALAKVVAMQQVPADISAALQRRLDQAQVPADQRPDYHKRVRFCFDFCTSWLRREKWLSQISSGSP
jgi:hypothetical protein